MSSIFLFIPDPSLREAVVEQILATKIGEPIFVETTEACLKHVKDEESPLIVMDRDMAEKEAMTLVEMLEVQAKKPTLLMLGKADDYQGATETFMKPLRLGHLMARLRYYSETAPLLRDRTILFGAYHLEPKNRLILHKSSTDPIRLTEKETALLVFLAQAKKPSTRRDILASVWGYDENIDTHTLETHIYQLRRKLDHGGDPWLINEAGVYRLAHEQKE
jgi:DNA-binding response OmpR family regulator